MHNYITLHDWVFMKTLMVDSFAYIKEKRKYKWMYYLWTLLFFFNLHYIIHINLHEAHIYTFLLQIYKYIVDPL